MYLVKAIHIKKNNPAYQELDSLMFLSKNLYNTCLYRERQCYFSKRDKVKEGIEDGSPWFIKEFDLIRGLTQENQADYRALPAMVAQQVCMQAAKEFKSFLALKKKNPKASIPRYKDKEHGRNIIKYSSQNGALKKSGLKSDRIALVKSGISFAVPDYIDTKTVREVHFSFTRNMEMRMHIIYQTEDVRLKKANRNYAAVDLGVTNLAAVAANSPKMKPLLVNGRPLKSLNQFYNRKKAYLQSRLSEEKGGRHISEQIRAMNRKREHRINDYLHKASRMVVNHLVSHKVNTLVIGYNREWKQEINIGHANNQTFVSIPHRIFVNMLVYKSAQAGINCILSDEDHTSVCSFFDGEPVRQADKHLGRRIRRGLYRTAQKQLVNADVNAALNILRHAVPDVKFTHHGIEGYGNPVRITV